MILVFDTETSGKYNFHESPYHDQQPDLVQFCAILLDYNFNEQGRISLMVKQRQKLSAEVMALHGITFEATVRYGVSRTPLLYVIDDLLLTATTVVAHNIRFDIGVVEAQFCKDGLTLENLEWPKQRICTMFEMTGKVPGLGGKWPKLSEAYKFVTGSQFINAHDAMADCDACVAILKYLVKHNHIQIQCKPATPIPRPQ